MTAPALTLFFDGNCPFCAAEMLRLKRRNSAGHLSFVDIAEPGFDPLPLGVTMTDLDRDFHSRTASGKILVGIDSMLAGLYRRFARNRYFFSRWFGYKPIARCENGVCHAHNPFLK